jgi:hypothetical protein
MQIFAPYISFPINSFILLYFSLLSLLLGCIFYVPPHTSQKIGSANILLLGLGPGSAVRYKLRDLTSLAFGF